SGGGPRADRQADLGACAQGLSPFAQRARRSLAEARSPGRGPRRVRARRPAHQERARAQDAARPRCRLPKRQGRAAPLLNARSDRRWTGRDPSKKCARGRLRTNPYVRAPDFTIGYPMLRIIQGDLRDPRVVDLLRCHLARARAETAPGSAHALDLPGLQSPDISFWTVWDDDRLLGIGA